jgi:AraC-like DNA-binding protein
MSNNEYPKIYLYRRVVQSKLFIDEHYSGSIDLEKISDEACFSKFHFIRLFKTVYGKTPHQYLIHVRLEKAKDLLRLEHSVSEVCRMVGFDSLGSFSTLFKKLNGIAPSLYQQNMLILRENLSSKPLNYIPGCFSEKNGWKEKAQF